MPHDDIVGSGSKMNTWFMYGPNLTISLIHKSGIGVGGSCEGAKQSLRQAECSGGMLCEMQGMWKLRVRFYTLESCEGG